MDNIALKCLIHQLRGVDHSRGCHAGFLIESILYELLLQPEVLKLLLLLALSLLIRRVIHLAQFANLHLLLILHLNVF